MKINFELDFLYYQPENYVLDGKDEKKEKLRPHSIKFKKFINEASLENLIELLVFSYAKEYANNIYWYNRFMGDLDRNTIFPKELNPHIDVYLEKKEITKKQLSKVIFKMYDDIEKNCYYTKWMYFEFTNQQSLSTLLGAIKKGLKDINYTETENDSIVTIDIEDSAILNITVSSNDLRIELNSKKWKVYRGV